MLPELFFYVTYLVLGAAVATGVRLRGFWDWTHLHEIRCHKCLEEYSDSYGRTYKTVTCLNNACYKKCRAITVGGNPMPLISLFFFGITWPLSVIYYLIVYAFVAIARIFFWVPIVFNALLSAVLYKL